MSLCLFLCSTMVISGCTDKNTGTGGIEKPDDTQEPGDTEEPGETDKPGSENNECINFSTFEANLLRKIDLEIPLKGEWNLRVKGFKMGDNVTIRPKGNASSEWKFECSKADDTEGAYISVPDNFHFAGGLCSISISANGKTISQSDIFVRTVDNGEVEKKPGYTSYGRVIDHAGNPIANVAVSDGVLVTTTDGQGRYYLRSERKEGSVFVSVPKNYRVAVKNTVPQFFQKYRGGKSTYEIHNFILAPETNENCKLLIFTDTHLANRTDDKNQFVNYFLPDIKAQIKEAESSGTKIYALALGDLAWDEYWYKNSFALPDYLKLIEGLDLAIYSCPGNHDNDPNISDDFKAAASFRDNICPTTYSMNIGDIHYIMMDNTLFYNNGGNVQDYKTGFTDEQMRWLEADLKTVPAGTTIFFGTHIPTTNRPGKDNTFSYQMPAEYRTTVMNLLDKYTVHFVSGHTHINYTNRISAKMVEHNIAAVCGTWWWTGYYTKNRCRINGDGSPSGYKVFEIKGNDIKWHYKSLGRDASYQFRAYDLKNCRITRDAYCPNSKTSISDSFFSQYAFGWDQASNTTSTNKILINVFDYDVDWKIEVTENGTPLNVSQVEGYDPLHVVHFNMERMSSGTTGSTNMTFPTGKTAHLFEASTINSTSAVVIKVTDSFGNVYQETMSRPRRLTDMRTSDKW